MSGSGRFGLGEIGLLLAGVATSLAIAEGIARLSGAADEKPTGYRPVRTGRRAAGPFNSRGHRDAERVIPKPAGVRRVVSLGDSFAYGVGVELDDTYAQRLERALNRRPGEQWEVVQLARPGIGTVEETEQLEQEGFAYQPDVVVLGFVLNDCEEMDAAHLRREREWLEAERAAQERGGLALWRLVRERFSAALANRDRVANCLAEFAPHYPGWNMCQKAMQRMGALCKQRAVPLVVMIFPLFENPLDDRYPFAAIHEQVAGLAGASGATVLDLLPAYRGMRWEILVVNGPRDEHPNEIAHRIAARALYGLLDKTILPRLPGAPSPGS